MFIRDVYFSTGSYTISVTTGTISKADTMAYLIYSLRGTLGDTDTITLSNGRLYKGK